MVIQSDARCSPPKTRAASTPEPLLEQEPVAVSVRQFRSSDPPDCPGGMECELASHVSCRKNQLKAAKFCTIPPCARAYPKSCSPIRKPSGSS